MSSCAGVMLISIVPVLVCVLPKPALEATFSMCSGEARSKILREILIPWSYFRASLNVETYYFIIIQVLYDVNFIIKWGLLCFCVQYLNMCVHPKCPGKI